MCVFPYHNFCNCHHRLSARWTMRGKSFSFLPPPPNTRSNPENFVAQCETTKRHKRSKKPIEDESRSSSSATTVTGKHKNNHQNHGHSNEQPPKFFDMEKFKKEMRKQDGIVQPPSAPAQSAEFTTTSTLVTSASFSSTSSTGVNEPDFEKVEVSSSRQKSRFGGRFFRLDDEEEVTRSHGGGGGGDDSTGSPLESLPHAADQRADPLSNLNSLAAELPKQGTTSGAGGSLLMNMAAGATPSTPTRSGPAVTQTPPLQKKFSFSAGVPTSVIRKMSHTADVKLEVNADKRKLSMESSLRSHEISATGIPSIPSIVEQQPSVNLLDSFGGPFASIPNSRHTSKTVSPGSSRASPVLSPGRTSPIGQMAGPTPPQPQPMPNLMEPIVHVGPDGQKMELPPPHIFVQMLIANNMPIPPELMAFLPPPQMMGGFIPPPPNPMQPPLAELFDMLNRGMALPPSMGNPQPHPHQQQQPIFQMGPPGSSLNPNLLSQLFATPHPSAGTGSDQLSGKVYTLEDIEKRQ